MHRTGLAFFKGLAVCIQSLAKLPAEALPGVLQAIGNGVAVACNSMEDWAAKERESEAHLWNHLSQRITKLEQGGKK